MPLNKILTIVNTSHEVGDPKAFSIEGEGGNPSVRLNKLSSASLDLYKCQLDDKFADTLHQYKLAGLVNVLLDGTVLTESEVAYLKYPQAIGTVGTDEYVKVGPTGTPDYLSDTYFSSSGGTHIIPIQRINDSGTGVSNLWSASKIISSLSTKADSSTVSSHIGDSTIHRSINDSTVSTTGLWSSNKINTELGDKADADHVHFLNPRVVFKEEFVGTGTTTTFTLTGSILNGTFTSGSWNVSRLLITFNSDVTGLDSKPTFDSTNLFTRHRVEVVSISSGGVVTLNYAPRNGVHFYVWYWYEVMDGDVLDNYIREDYVAVMEETSPSIASEVPVNASGFSGRLSATDTDVQTALGTLDTHTHSFSTSDIAFPEGGAGVTSVDYLNEAINNIWSSTSISGFALTENLDGTVNIDSGEIVIRPNTTANSPLVAYPVSAVSNLVLTDNDENYVYVSYNSGVPIIAATTLLTSTGRDKVIIHAVFRRGTTLYSKDLRQQAVDGINRLIIKNIAVDGFEHVKGGSVLSEIGTLNVAVTAGAFYFGVTRLSHVAFDTSAGGTFSYFYRSALGGWTEVSGRTQIDNLKYDDGSGILATLSNNKYGVHWVYVVFNTPDHLHIVYGQGNYDNLVDAQSATIPTSLPGWLCGLCSAVLVGKIIVQKGVTTFADIQSPFVDQLISGTPAVHNDLGGLQGGTLSEYYHLTSAKHTTLGGLTTLVQGDIAYGSAANTWSLLNKSTTANSFIKNSGTSNNPAWSTVNTTDLVTAVSGLLKGNGTSVVQALSGTDYEPPVLKGNLTESTSSVLSINNGTGAVIGTGTSIQVIQSDSTHSGYLSSTDWNTFNNKANQSDVDNLENALWDSNEPTGFVNRSDSIISFDNGAMKLTIAPAVTSFDIYERGVKYTKSSPEFIVITDVEGVHLIYYSSGVLTESVNPITSVVSELIRTKTIVSYIYWDFTNKEAIYVGEERHGIQMDGNTHTYLHFSEGLRYLNGLGLVSFSVDGDGSSNAHAQFGMELGGVADEDIYDAISAISSTTGLPVYYKIGSSPTWRKTVRAGYSVIVTGNPGETRLAYNQYTGGAWQLTQVTSGNFVLCHVFATTEKDKPIISIVGENQYTNIASARIGATTEIRSLVLNNTLFPEIRPLGTVIFQTSNSYTNAVLARVRSTDTGESYVDWRSEAINRVSITTSDHNALANLQGGVAGERYHSTSAQNALLVSLYSSVYVDGSGNVGINTTDFDGVPSIGKLVVKGSTNDGSTNVLVCRDSDEANLLTLDTDGKPTSSAMYSGYTVGGTNKAVYVDDNGLIGVTSSSIRTKQDVVDMEDISWIDSLRPVNFAYKSTPEVKQYGLIAEEVLPVNPDLVGFDSEGLPDSVTYDRLVPVLLKAIQELRAEISSLKSKL